MVRDHTVTPETAEITLSAALFYPVIASVVLLSMYYLYSYVQSFLILYISISAVFCIAQVVEPVIVSLLSPYVSQKRFITFISIFVSFLIVVCWIIRGGSLFNNIIGICITISALSLMRAQSLKVIVVAFCLLFFYDIFWVFFSESLFGKNVMVTVAQQNFTEPVKTSILHVLSPSVHQQGKLVLSTLGGQNVFYLGLGDIFIPGLLFVFFFIYQKENTFVLNDVESGSLAEMSDRTGDEESKKLIDQGLNLYMPPSSRSWSLVM
ncbi:uncharacterized protein [Blastocystis hominis]|uniref:Uncharacterized protein n=1 Tax=Blastocystis hominis TaxID=12968 RepID=D8LW33_BLAHO|nr:uncharacterized protein [Blastocystis hominis]CBK20022.2 unnamed protein product [Blastocystis hominis]|eukprot:XP_012894070.1 uncharacterized protein [Blastocystis hominis]